MIARWIWRRRVRRAMQLVAARAWVRHVTRRRSGDPGTYWALPDYISFEDVSLVMTLALRKQIYGYARA